MIKLNSDYSDYTDETDSNYPLGKAVNASTSESYDGTPLLAEFMNDVNASHIAMYKKAYGNTTGITGNADKQTGSQFADAIAKYSDDKLTAHDNKRGTNAHGATVGATAGQLMTRDASGRSQVSDPVASADIATKNYVDAGISAHATLTNNPHAVTKAQVGLGNCNNTSDADKPVSTATQTALNGKVDKTAGVTAVSYDSTNKKITRTINGTAADVVTVATLKSAMALNNCNNTSDADKPVSTATQTALNGKVDKTAGVTAVSYDSTNKKITRTINGTAADVVTVATLKSAMALNNCNNTSDADKPVSTATQTALNGKVDKTAGVTAVSYDSTNKKITRTINGTAADVVTVATLKTDMALNNVSNVATESTITQNSSKNITSGAVYTALAGKVPTGRTVNSKALSSNVTLYGGDIAMSSSDTTTLKSAIDGKVEKTAGVTAVSYDSTNKKITRTINGTAADVVTVATLKSAMSLAKGDVGLGSVANKATDSRGSTTSTNNIQCNVATGMANGAVCSTAGGTQAKLATIPGFSLFTGAIVRILFQNENTVAAPTLNISYDGTNYTGAKSIKVIGSNGVKKAPDLKSGYWDMNTAGTATNKMWQANTILELFYDGTDWVVMGNPVLLENHGTSGGYEVLANGLIRQWNNKQCSHGVLATWGITFFVKFSNTNYNIGFVENITTQWKITINKAVDSVYWTYQSGGDGYFYVGVITGF